jgi:hypothetical protein
LEPTIVDKFASGLLVYKYRDYEGFVAAAPSPGTDDGLYPMVSRGRDGDNPEYLTPSLTYSIHRRCESVDEALTLGLKLAKEWIDETLGEP